MKKSIFLPVCLLVVAVATARAQLLQPPPQPQPQPSWKTYVMKEAELRFTVPMFPSTHVTKEKRDQPLPERQKHVFDSSADGVMQLEYTFDNHWIR